MSPNQLSRRMSPGPLSRNRNMSVLATLPTPNMKRKLSTIHKKLDAEELANHVEANTVQAAFLGNKRRGNRELLNKIVEQAHLSARGRYDDLSEGKGPLTLNMHWPNQCRNHATCRENNRLSLSCFLILYTFVEKHNRITRSGNDSMHNKIKM